jgi:hypothetical protein
MGAWIRFAAGVAATGVITAAGSAYASATLTSVVGAPSPSTVGQSVTLTATFDIVCTGSVAFTDGGNGNAALCTANLAGSTTGTCSAPFPTPGTRTVTGTPSGITCGGLTRTYSQTVNAAAAVPTVGEWTMWGLAGLLLTGGAVMLARRTRQMSGPGDLGAA